MSRAVSKTVAIGVIIVIIIIIGVAAYYLLAAPGKPATTTPPSPTPTTPPTSSTTPPTTPSPTTTPPPTSTTPPSTTTSPTTTTPPITTTTSPKPTATTPPAGPKATVIETSKAFIVVGPVGSTVPQFDSKGKQIIVVKYQIDEKKTKPIEKSTGFVDINPSFYRNPDVDALILAARKETNPVIREQLYEAIYKLSNEEVPTLWLGQYKLVFNYWSWVHGRYYHPTLAERWDLIWEDDDAPVVKIGIKDYANGPDTYVDVTHGWPDTFDPAADYETFGWAIWHNIGDALLTFWKEETKKLSPDLAVAWAHNKEGTEWYFVIRGGVKAYDPWHDKTYDISALDVLFTIWRTARLELDPSWMVTEFIDVNASKVYTEDEFNQVLSKGGIYVDYKGVSKEVKSLDELLQVFGYSGKTAGVVALKLYYPYSPILSILADPFLSVIPMKYLFDNVDQLKGKYDEAVAASENGKKPEAWAKYIGKGEQEPTHLFLHKYPPATGPYYVKEYQENSYIVLEYNPYYWNATLWQTLYNQPKPKHERVIFLINDDAVARIEILKRGQADYGAIPLERLKDIKGYKYPGKEKFQIVVEERGLEPTIVYIVLNAHKPPFNNKLVRQALMYAVPFDQIKTVVYANYLERLYGVIPAGFPGHNDDIVIKYNFDLAKAMQLIKKSGIDPAKYSFKIWYNRGNTQREKIATLLQQTWGKLGFKITVEPLEWPTLLSRTEKGDFDVYIIGWAPDYLDPDNYAGPLFYGGTKFSTLVLKTVAEIGEAQDFFKG